MRPTFPLFLMQLIFSLALAGCATPERQTNEPPSADPSNRIATQPTALLLPTSTAPLETTARPTQSSQATEELSTPVEENRDRCGVILPIVPTDPGSPITQVPSNNVPTDLAPEAALPALERMVAAPESVGLAAYQIGREAEGAYLNADIPMPLASVVKILNLIAYAEAADSGVLDPATWIPLADLERTYLHRTDLGAHNRALAELEDRGLIGLSPPSTPLEEIPWMMIRHSSNASSDFLHLMLGQETIEAAAVDLGLESQTAPCPFIGQFLAMANHTRTGSNLLAVQGYIDDPASYGVEVMHLAQTYANQDSFRQEEANWRRRQPDIGTQRIFSENLNAQASARDYAGLMGRIMGNGLSSAYINILVRRVMEWPMIFPANQELFSTVGYKNGSLPGILTTTYYAQRKSDGAQVVVALFYRQLPIQTYRQWRNSLPHDELARWLLTDPEAIPALRNWLNED